MDLKQVKSVEDKSEGKNNQPASTKIFNDLLGKRKKI